MKVKYQGTNDEKVRQQVKKEMTSNDIISAFLNKRPEEIEDWVDSNVNDFDAVKKYLKELTKMIRYIIAENNNVNNKRRRYK